MINRKLALGAGIPGGPSAAGGLSVSRVCEKPDAVVARSPASDLASDVMETGQWPVPDQGIRGTCTAFAVAAAEEIWHFNQSRSSHCDGVVLALSKEYLYSAMRVQSFASVGVALEPEREAELLAAGATYLSQAKKALETAGVCREELAPYTPGKAVNFYRETFSREANADALTRVVETDAFAHSIVNLTEGPAIGQGRIWEPSRPGLSTSQIFAKALAAGSPVVAAFPILEVAGISAWFGLQARLCGRVQYPGLREMANYQLKGGHTVCITGYLPDDDNPAQDRFVFRNSYGVRDFCSDALHARSGGMPRWRGFGVISAADVDAFCWEYLYRKHDSDTPAASPFGVLR